MPVFEFFKEDHFLVKQTRCVPWKLVVMIITVGLWSVNIQMHVSHTQLSLNIIYLQCTNPSLIVRLHNQGPSSLYQYYLETTENHKYWTCCVNICIICPISFLIIFMLRLFQIEILFLIAGRLGFCVISKTKQKNKDYFQKWHFYWSFSNKPLTNGKKIIK